MYLVRVVPSARKGMVIKMKKSSRFFSLFLACVFAIGCVSHTAVSVSAAETTTVLFEETFSSNSYASTTSYEGKTGAWTEEDKTNNGLAVNQDGGEGKIYPNQSSGGARVFRFDEEYQGAMLLKVTADILTGASTNSSASRLDVFSEGGRITVCRFVGGTIYANTMGNEAAYSTGATYQYEHRHTVTAIIDEANETFTLSVHDDDAGTDVLKDYSVPNYKHNKTNWAKMTSGFKGVYFYSTRTGGGRAESLYSIKVEQIHAPWSVTSDNITLTDALGAVQNDWSSVNKNLQSVTIDFGTAMDASTLTSNSVYIENSTTAAKVSYTGNYSDNVYTMTLNENLDASKVYKIVIATSVKTATGAGNDEQKSFSFTTAASSTSAVLFEETFSSNSYASTTSYEGKTGAWTEVEKTGNGLGVNQDGGEGKIYANQSSGGAKVFTFDEEYEAAMRIKVTADIKTGASTNSSASRLDIFSDDGRITVCRFIGGTIYANTMGSEAAYSTGATYQYEHRHTVTAIIDEAKETFTLSIHDDTADTDVLKDYIVPNYKHSKSNWEKMTSGFKGVYYYSTRTGGGAAESLYSIKVEELPTPWTVTSGNITFTDKSDIVQDDLGCVNVNLGTIAVDFGKAMDTSTLTANNVYIEKVSSGEKVSYTGNYNNNVYTLSEISSLEGLTEYRLVMTTAVKTAAGVGNEENMIVSFTTSDVNTSVVLFEETFSSNSYASTTEYAGKTGAWSDSDVSGNGLSVNQNDGEGKIYANQSSGGAKVFTFTEEYEGAMRLKVTADIKTGASTNSSASRIDVFSDSGRITVCQFIGGTIYANTMSATAAYSTGATYQYEHRHTVTAIIDEAKEIFTLSIHDDTAGTDVLTDYVVPNYKHNKTNWEKMTSGFKGIYYYSSRTGGGAAESLYSIKVEQLPVSWSVTQADVTLTDSNNNVQSLNNASLLTNKIAIDFGVNMYQSGLNSDSVYIEKHDDGTKVSYTSAYSDGVYTMTLTGLLEAGTQYDIVISNTVKTAGGIGNENSTVISFTTAGGSSVESDYGYDRNFTFDNLDGWTKAGRTDSSVSEGKLTVPTSSTGERIVKYNFDPIFEDKMNLEITYDIYPGENTSSRVQVDGNVGYIALANFKDGSIYANAYGADNPVGVAYEAGKLYKVRCQIDQNDTTLHIWIYDENNNMLVDDYKDAPFGGNNGRGANIVGLKNIQIVNNVEIGGGLAPIIDNLVVREILSAPKFLASSVSIGTLSGEMSNVFANVDPISNAITFNLGTAIDTATLTANSVQVLKNGTPIGTSLSYNNRIITVIINDALLANTTYTVSISGNIANKDGVELGNDAEIEFTTGAASTKATIGRVAIDDNEITELSQILTGDHVDVEIDYTNSTRTNQTLYLIVASYSNHELKHASYTATNIDASVTRSTVSITSGDILKGDDVDEVMVMLWDDFEKMHPISPYRRFK